MLTWRVVRAENSKSDFPPMSISVKQWVPNPACMTQHLPKPFQRLSKADTNIWRENWETEFAIRLSQYISFLKIIDTMFLSGGWCASPKMQSANHAKRVNRLSLLETGGNFVSGYFLPMTVTCKSLMRAVKSPASKFECCPCRITVPQAFVICSL